MKVLGKELSLGRGDGPVEGDVLVLLERSERRAWNVVKGLLAVLAISVAGNVTMGKLKQVSFVPIITDAATGDSRVGRTLDADTVPAIEALDKASLTAYVSAREGYAWHFLQDFYDTVRVSSLPGIFQPYAALYDGAKGRDKVWADRQLHKVVVTNRRLTGPVPGSTDERGAVVSFEVRSNYLDRSQPDTTARYVATVHFRYAPDMELNERERALNPFGFQVTAYRTDPVLSATGGMQ